MIVTIEGVILRASPVSAVIEAGGLGYLVHVPVTTAARLPATGKVAKLHVHAVYREDSQSLYGFSSEEERDFFALLIDKVSGVGPKVGISLFSKLELSELIVAIRNENAALLAKTPGIGKKTAERVIIELKDKLANFPMGPTGLKAVVGQESSAARSAGDTRREDAVLALLALGYKRSEAEKSIDRVIESAGVEASTESLIKAALS